MMVNLPCLMGSYPNFLRTTCSYTECRLSFRTGSCPTERTSVSYSSCLFFILLTFSFRRVRIFRGCFALLSFLGLFSDAALFVLHLSQVSFQNPARFQHNLKPSKALILLCNRFVFSMLPGIPAPQGA